MLRLFTGSLLDVDSVWDREMGLEPAMSEHGRFRTFHVGNIRSTVKVRSQAHSDNVLPSFAHDIIECARPDHNRLIDYCGGAAKSEIAPAYSLDPSSIMISHTESGGPNQYNKKFDHDHYLRWMQPVLPEIEKRESAYQLLAEGAVKVYYDTGAGIRAQGNVGIANTALAGMLKPLIAASTGGMSLLYDRLFDLLSRAAENEVRLHGVQGALENFDQIPPLFRATLGSVRHSRTTHLEDIDQEFGVTKRQSIVRSWDHADSLAESHIRNVQSIKVVELADSIYNTSLQHKLRGARVTSSGHALELARIGERRHTTGLRGLPFQSNDGHHDKYSTSPNFNYPKDKKQHEIAGESFWMDNY